MSASDPTEVSADTAEVIAARRREMAVEHILFGALRHLAGRHPAMLDELEANLPHLWDRSEGTARDDEAVREIARRFIRSLRAEA
ncbi:hypothetical protein [Methylorubrum aminovorans]|uniref:hypothetical protein n=1 Tax=Methylorubrum aminovorans TaxID=269069 RepID=UPI003C2B3FEC